MFLAVCADRPLCRDRDMYDEARLWQSRYGGVCLLQPAAQDAKTFQQLLRDIDEQTPTCLAVFCPGDRLDRLLGLRDADRLAALAGVLRSGGTAPRVVFYGGGVEALQAATGLAGALRTAGATAAIVSATIAGHATASPHVWRDSLRGIAERPREDGGMWRTEQDPDWAAWCAYTTGPGRLEHPVLDDIELTARF